MTVHLQDQDLELYLLERVPKNNISAMDSHLADCGACDQRLVQEISLLPLSNLDPLGVPGAEEKRREPRYQTEDAVSLQALSPFSANRHLGKLADVSRSGMKIQTPVRVESGTLIKISLKNVIAFGESRYCVKMGDGFHFGVQLSQVVSVRRHDR